MPGAPLARALAAAPASPPSARATALREAIGTGVRRCSTACPTTSRRRRASALAQHLAAQAMRDVALLKPSLLQEISKG